MCKFCLKSVKKHVKKSIVFMPKKWKKKIFLCKFVDFFKNILSFRVKNRWDTKILNRGNERAQ